MLTRRRAVVALMASFAGCRCGATSTPPSTVVPTVDAAVDAGPKPDAETAVVDASPAEEGWTIAAIVVDDAGAYWFSSVHQLVTQKPSGEGAPASFAKADGQPAGLALDAKRVYWVEDGQLVAAARADRTKQVIAKLTRPRGLVIDGRSALVVADDGDNSSAIFRVALDGGAKSKLASVPVGTMALAVDGASIFVVAGGVLRIPKSGGAPKKVSDAPEEAKEIVFVRDDIVFLGMDPQAMTGRVWSMPKRGPAPEPAGLDNDFTMVMYAGAMPVSGEDGTVVSLATDGKRPFWITTSNDPDVKTASLQMPSAKGKDDPTELAKVPPTSGLAVYRSRLYWSAPDGVKSMPVPR
jgi:hypothetical protein